MVNSSLRAKIIALVLAALGACQIATLCVVLIASHRSVRDQIERELVTADAVFQRLFDRRYLQLLESVDVLGSDYGFKRAAASGDVPTIVSALDNHGSRVGAAIAVLVGPEGAVRASTQDNVALFSGTGWRETIDSARQHDLAVRTLDDGAVVYQLVVVPVLAPERIGWLVMGFHVDNTLAADFKRLTGRDVSFVSVAASPHLLASTLAPAVWPEIAAALPATWTSTDVHELRIGDRDYLTRAHLLDQAASTVAVVLQESLSEAFAPYRRLAVQLVGLFVVTLLAACFGGVLLARGITRPIGSLVAAAARIAEGDYATRIDVGSNGEVGLLARTLDTMQREISEREHRIVHQAQHDDLTGLPNRWLARERLDGAIQRASDTGRSFCVAQLDLSRFKQINETFGHPIGDTVLEETANRLRACLRESDTVARLGGDDFLVVLEDLNLAEARDALAAIHARVCQPVQLEELRLSLDLRLGIAMFPAHGEDAITLMRRSEIALHDAKDSHQRMIVYAAGRDDGHLRQLAIVSDLERALGSGEMSLHYQPKVNMIDGHAGQAEALVRWNHPEFGFIPPDEFVQILEESGNISTLTQWVIATAVTQARRWLSRGLDVKISVNLSAVDLLNEELPSQLLRELSATGLTPAQLALEVTESALMRDPRTAIAVLGRLRDVGFRVSIDDFGTGYSSLAQLKRLPVNDLKIDKSFVLDLDAASEDAMIVRSTIDLAHSMGLTVIAEGVETTLGWTLLKQYGCDVAQGYLISKPLPADDFERWLGQIHAAGGVFMLEAA